MYEFFIKQHHYTNYNLEMGKT